MARDIGLHLQMGNMFHGLGLSRSVGRCLRIVSFYDINGRKVLSLREHWPEEMHMAYCHCDEETAVSKYDEQHKEQAIHVLEIIS